jgi:hypothetical protein
MNSIFIVLDFKFLFIYFTVVENVNREFVKWNEDKLHGVKRKWSRVELEE